MDEVKIPTDGLIVQGIGKAYKNKKVLHNVDLKLQKGEVVALLGPNGAGKTTCFYSIAGLISPDKGSVTVDGFDATNLPMYRRAQLGLGYLPQEASIFRGLNVEQNISAVALLFIKGYMIALDGITPLVKLSATQVCSPVCTFSILYSWS